MQYSAIVILFPRCPLKKQNYDYAMYLLTAVYHESWVGSRTDVQYSYKKAMTE